MPDLDDMIEQLRRMRADPGGPVKDWYRMSAKAGSRRAEVRIYDDIGWMGTSAKTFAQELDALQVDEIDLRLNSPGGDAWDGIAIYNALRRHKARINVTVDGIAASAASIIAMAGDSVSMSRGSQLMIHDAWGLVIGNADDLADAMTSLDKLSAGMADIYAARAGGDVATWREAMRAESWYTAQEAVDAGLADALVDDTASDDGAQARWDLRTYAFAYAGRAAAPAPTITPRSAAPTTATPAGTPTKKGAGMDPAKIREALGLGPDAPDDEVTAAFAKAVPATAPAKPDPDGDAEPEPDDEPEPPKAKARKTTKTAGVMSIDASVWEETQARMKSLEAQAARQARDERDKVIAQAVADGKFAPARKQHWAKLWDADPEGTRETIGQLAKNVVPLSAVGYDLDGGEPDEDYRALFPTSKKAG
jgi:ATP-dependent protease ClpP protease subunit